MLSSYVLSNNNETLKQLFLCIRPHPSPLATDKRKTISTINTMLSRCQKFKNKKYNLLIIRQIYELSLLSFLSSLLYRSE